MPQKPKIKKTAQEKAAAMFGVTAMSKEELSNAVETGSVDAGNPIENFIENTELEQMHKNELAEAKELELETEPIMEATTNEIITGLQKELEESQNRYVELSEDKEKIAKENSELKKKISELLKTNSDLSKEHEELSKKVNELYSELDVFKTDSSREILDYKIQIEDFQKQISAYQQNESSYKFEITKLKAEINNLETALTEKPEARKALDSKLHAPAPRTVVPMFAPKPKKNGIQNASRANGYESWN